MNRSCHTDSATSTSLQSVDTESHVISGHHHETGSTSAHHNHIGVEKEEPHSHSSNSDEGCCEEMTGSVVSSLIAQKAEVPSLEARLFFIFEIKLSTFQSTYNNLFTDNFKFYYSDSSPPTIQGDIYVFVQSFLL